MSNGSSALVGGLPQIAPRGKLVAIMAVFVAPVLAAAVAYLGWHPGARSNYGELLEVMPLHHTQGVTADGKLDLKALHGKWLLVRVGSGACDTECARQLYLMRQIRLSLGKDQWRIERVWVLADDAKVDTALLREHPRLHVWRPQDSVFLAQFPPASDGAASIYLVDPLGNRMLRFPPRPDPKGMLKDLKLLLKASQVG